MNLIAAHNFITLILVCVNLLNQVVGVLLTISYIGSLFNFLTLIYICKFYASVALSLLHPIIFFLLRNIGLNIPVIILSGVLLSLSLPVLYDKYQDRIDEKIHVIHGVIHPHYQKICNIVLSIIPKRTNKEKKVQ
jgi:hypothetical protein